MGLPVEAGHGYSTPPVHDKLILPEPRNVGEFAMSPEQLRERRFVPVTLTGKTITENADRFTAISRQNRLAGIGPERSMVGQIAFPLESFLMQGLSVEEQRRRVEGLNQGIAAHYMRGAHYEILDAASLVEASAQAEEGLDLFPYLKPNFPRLGRLSLRTISRYAFSPKSTAPDVSYVCMTKDAAGKLDVHLDMGTPTTEVGTVVALLPGAPAQVPIVH